MLFSWPAGVNHFLMRVCRKAQTRRVLAWPETLQINPTNACNIRCRNCPKTYYATDNRHMTPEVYERVRAQLLPHARRVHLQGLGEPLLAPLFPQLLDDAVRHGLEVHFVTNGTLLDRDMARRIVQAGAQVAVSLDGATAATHERSRPGAKFEQILGGLRFLRESKEAQPSSGFHLSISTVVNRLNLAELEDLIGIAGEHGAVAMTLINPGVGERDDLFAAEAIGKHPQRFLEILPALQARARALNLKLFHPRFDARPATDRTDPPPQPEPAPRPERLFPGRCFDPWTMVYIEVDGGIRPCCRAVWVGMGNLLHEDFRAIWNNAHYRRLRASVNSNNPPSFCRTCALNTGITLGDELWVRNLEARGISLPAAPKIGENEQ